MRRFTELYLALDATNATLDKRALLRAFFDAASDDEAGVALHVLTGGRLKRAASTALLRRAIETKTGLPGWLIGACRESVGDFSEAAALLAPGASAPCDETLDKTWCERLVPFGSGDDETRLDILTSAWANFDADQRLVFHKLIRGGFRVGVQRTTVAHALAELSGVGRELITQRLTGGVEPTAESFRAVVSPETQAIDAQRPYPFFLASALDPRDTPADDESEADAIDADAAHIERLLGEADRYQAEWKYDGIRAQLIRRTDDGAVLFSRGEEIVTEQFPEVIAAAASAIPAGTVLDGELVMAGPQGEILPFAQLQTRLNRKAKNLAQPSLFDRRGPVFIAYDILEQDGNDLRDRTTEHRRFVLEALLGESSDADTIRLAPALRDARGWRERAALRRSSRQRGVEGLMLKHRDAPYHAGRTRSGPTWWKWKVDPFTIDAVLVYAQPGTGRRAMLYTDYTFALWDADHTRDDNDGADPETPEAENAPRELVTFAKAYSGLSQEEIERVDRFVRNNTVDRMGPVRKVTPELVFELGFESVQRSDRHASGLAVRFPRMLRWRHDKPASEADTIAELRRMLPSEMPNR